MGGYGSGRRWGSSKDTNSDFRRLDVRPLHRNGFLLPGRSSTMKWSRDGEVVASIGLRAEWDRVILSYRHCSAGTEDWQSLEYSVALEWTPCNYGGPRVVAMPRARLRAPCGGSLPRKVCCLSALPPARLRKPTRSTTQPGADACAVNPRKAGRLGKHGRTVSVEA
jgi:hypothetical protein